jgi:hypothetical protein
MPVRAPLASLQQAITAVATTQPRPGAHAAATIALSATNDTAIASNTGAVCFYMLCSNVSVAWWADIRPLHLILD